MLNSYFTRQRFYHILLTTKKFSLYLPCTQVFPRFLNNKKFSFTHSLKEKKILFFFYRHILRAKISQFPSYFLVSLAALSLTNKTDSDTPRGPMKQKKKRKKKNGETALMKFWKLLPQK